MATRTGRESREVSTREINEPTIVSASILRYWQQCLNITRSSSNILGLLTYCDINLQIQSESKPWSKHLDILFKQQFIFKSLETTFPEAHIVLIYKTIFCEAFEIPSDYFEEFLISHFEFNELFPFFKLLLQQYLCFTEHKFLLMTHITKTF